MSEILKKVLRLVSVITKRNTEIAAMENEVAFLQERLIVLENRKSTAKTKRNSAVDELSGVMKKLTPEESSSVAPLL